MSYCRGLTNYLHDLDRFLHTHTYIHIYHICVYIDVYMYIDKYSRYLMLILWLYSESLDQVRVTSEAPAVT